jgi:hypothetical protein
MKEIDEKIIVYSEGICYASVCADKECCIDEITEFLNLHCPSGIQTDWKLSDDDFLTGEKNGCPCNKDSDRLHYLFTC